MSTKQKAIKIDKTTCKQIKVGDFVFCNTTAYLDDSHYLFLVLSIQPCSAHGTVYDIFDFKRAITYEGQNLADPVMGKWHKVV